MGRHESRNAKRHKTTEEDKAIGLKQISEDENPGTMTTWFELSLV